MVQQHLESLEHLLVGPDAEPCPPVTRMLAVFLGFGFDHFCITLRFGSVPGYVAEVLGIAKEDVYLLRQRTMFDLHTVAGRRPVCCFGFRNKRDMMRPFTGKGIFVDSRPVGRPINFREVHVPDITPRQLCVWLSVSVPDGFEPHCSGGEPVGSPDGAFRLEHESSILLWLEATDPPRISSSTSDESVDNESPSPVDGALGPPGPGAADMDEGSAGRPSRSRSPRGSGTDGTEGWQTCSGLSTGVATGLAPASRTLSDALHICTRPLPTPCRSLCKRAPPEGPDAVGRAVPPDTRHFAECPLAGMWSRVQVHDAIVDRRPEDTSASCTGTSVPSAIPLTLLETAAVDREGVCRLALDAMAEHCPAEVPGKVTIHLTQHVGPVVHCLSAPCVPLGRNLGDAMAFLQPWPFTLQSSVPTQLDLHPSTSHAISEIHRRVNQRHPADVNEFRIYTDGSFDDTRSAWAVVCVGLCNGVEVGLQWFTGPVCTAEDDPCWLGARQHGVQEAEHTALCYALLWILSACRSTCCSVLSDSLVAVQRARGLWQYPVDCTIAITCRCIAQVLEAIDICPWQVISHVRSHEGHQWNEFADVLAKDAVRHDTGFSFHLDLGSWVASRAIESLWLILATCRQPSVWPKLCDSNLVTDEAVRFADVPAASMFGIAPASRGERHCTKTSSLRIVSANVQSLEGGAHLDGLHSFEGRVGFIREQLYGLGAHVVAIQEARTERAESILSAQYIRLCSGRTPGGQLGVECWLIRQAKADGVCFQSEDLTVAFYDPRTICVRVKSCHLHAVLAVIHAPVAADPHRDSWWQTFCATLRRVAGDLPVVLLGDWNTRFAEAVCARVGDLVFPTVYPVSRFTWQVLDDFDLWLPSTFSSCHQGTCDTWHAPGGSACARLDYVSVPSTWWVYQGGSTVLHDVDLGHHSVDHLAIQLDVCFPRTWGPGRSP